MRFSGSLLFCFTVFLSFTSNAQQSNGSAMTYVAAGAPAVETPPVAADAVAVDRSGAVSGTVTDSSGAVVSGALVVLVDEAGKEEQRTLTNDDGRFRFKNVAAESFTLKVAAPGMESLAQRNSLLEGQLLEMEPIVLRVATANTDVQVGLTLQDIAEEDLRVEEKQRLGGFVPNFYVVYDWKAPPLTTKQKYKLAGRTVIDPATLIIVGGFAGIEQATNTFAGYGQGAAGYGKRYAAGFGDTMIGTVLGGAVLPSIFKQDPRYFYKGTGSNMSRALYALSTSVIARGDNGKWQPAYAAVGGDFASGAISNFYYPKGERSGVGETLEDGLLGIAFNGIGNLIQEFLLKKVTPGSRDTPKASP